MLAWISSFCARVASKLFGSAFIRESCPDFLRSIFNEEPFGLLTQLLSIIHHASRTFNIPTCDKSPIIMSDIMEKFWSAPPVSRWEVVTGRNHQLTRNRTLVAAIGLESLLIHGGLINGYYALFYMPFIFKFPLPQLWRFITPFLLTGGGFNALWDMYMFWTYTTELELSSPRFTQPGDFATYVFFIASSVMVSHLVLIHYTLPFCSSRLICLKRFLMAREITPTWHVVLSFAK